MSSNAFQRLRLIGVCLLLTGCQVMSQPLASSGGAKPHHTPQGFRNNYGVSGGKPFSQFLKWQWERATAPAPAEPPQATPTAAPELDFLTRNARAGAAMQPALTWIGHATLLMQADGLNVLTDPNFSERASPLGFAGPKRHQPPGVALAQLPRIDVVLISHNHYDHLDRDSVQALAQLPGGSPLFLVPLGLAAWMRDAGIDKVVELDWWEQHSLQGVEFQLTPVQHWSGRTYWDRTETLWGGWAVFGPGLHWYFAGDTGYSKDFADIRQRFAARQTEARGGGFDLALLPIGAYEPRWFMSDQHVNPAESVRIHRDLGAKRSVGMHWGTFALTDEPLDQPPKDLHQAREAQGVSAAEFALMAIGETQRLAPRAPTGRAVTAQRAP
ncbi:MBL fold metallo-hydrolase [Variovorax sp. LARHSF232]